MRRLVLQRGVNWARSPRGDADLATQSNLRRLDQLVMCAAGKTIRCRIAASRCGLPSRRHRQASVATRRSQEVSRAILISSRYRRATPSLPLLSSFVLCLQQAVRLLWCRMNGRNAAASLRTSDCKYSLVLTAIDAALERAHAPLSLAGCPARVSAVRSVMPAAETRRNGSPERSYDESFTKRLI